MLSSAKTKVSLDPPNSHTIVLDVPATPGHKAKDKEGVWPGRVRVQAWAAVGSLEALPDL